MFGYNGQSIILRNGGTLSIYLINQSAHLPLSKLIKKNNLYNGIVLLITAILLFT